MFKKILSFFISMKFSVILMAVFAIVTATGTFIENDYGNAVARAAIYNTWWFELLFVLISIGLINNIFKYKMWRLTKWSIFMFHISIIVILFGSALTRYFGYEGMMHIREGSRANTITTEEVYFSLSHGENTKQWKKRLSPITPSSFSHSLPTPTGKLSVQTVGYIHWAARAPVAAPDGVPLIVLRISDKGKGGSFDTVMAPGDRETAGGMPIVFSASASEKVDGIRIRVNEKGEVVILAREPMVGMNMSTQTNTMVAANTETVMAAKTVFDTSVASLIVREYIPSGKIDYVPASEKTDLSALRLTLTYKGESIERTIYGSHTTVQNPQTVQIGGEQFRMGLGPIEKTLPFYIRLNDFIMGRYPGSHTPSSYESKVTVEDPRSEPYPYHIYMNHILIHDNYRFYQSSYDADELGTILSVARDPGKIPVYIGFFLMSLGFLLQPFSKGSRYNRSLAGLVVAVALGVGTIHAQNPPAVSVEHAEKFSKLIVHDIQGRFKPAHSLAEEVVLKLSRHTDLYGQNPSQILLGMMARPDVWQEQPIIQLGHPGLGPLIGLPKGTKVAPFSRFLTPDGRYILQEPSEEANRIKPAERSKLQNKLLKLDERVSIAYTVLQGAELRLFPVPGSTTEPYFSPGDKPASVDMLYYGKAMEIWTNYISAVKTGIETGNYTRADAWLQKLSAFQKENSGYSISDSRLALEIKMNELHLFYRLAPIYLLTGFALMIFLFLNLVNPIVPVRIPLLLSWIFLLGAFAAHTAGLALRWNVAGHAPWSNGYESLVYIAWATALSSLIFGRSTPFVISSTSIMAGLALYVAHLSWMDPQVTTLVPVLKSYWLTIHVSVISGSYGFLALGALLGFFTLILFAMRSPARPRIDTSIRNLAIINEKTLMVGLGLLSIGNILGAVWANESWGRYWSWDPKETWTFIGIMVYSVVLHLRFIPALRSTFLFSASSVVAYASIIMTYFGVNFYLTGMHSYAAGDPVPIPTFVYYTLAVVAIAIGLAWRNSDGRVPLASKNE